MIIIDAHCDTLTKTVDTGLSLISNPFHWDITRALQYKGFLQVLAVFQDPDIVKPTFDHAMHYIREAEEVQKQDSRFKLCRNYQDIEDGIREKKVCGLLSLEGGDCLEGKLDSLVAFYNAGVRLITLTWNYANELGDGAQQARNGGLTSFGRKAVRWMQDNGMIVDISHADEKTFWDCMEISNRPVIASHSNARALYDHPRNLRDEQLQAIAKAQGVIGVNFYTAFIGPSGKTDMAALIRHIEYIAATAGEDAVGLGADFDGMESLPDQIEGVQSLNNLFNALARLNYSDQTLRKIAGGNFLTVFRNGLGQTGYNSEQINQGTDGINSFN